MSMCVVTEYVIPTKVEALSVLNGLVEINSKFGVVSVVDYYDLIGATSRFTDSVFGWKDGSIEKSTIRPVMRINNIGNYNNGLLGYRIEFPELEEI